MDKKEKNQNNEEKNNNVDNIEVVIGDESVLEISEVNDCMNTLRPKDSVSKRKKFIIPIAKKKIKKDEE